RRKRTRFRSACSGNQPVIRGRLGGLCSLRSPCGSCALHLFSSSSHFSMSSLYSLVRRLRSLTLRCSRSTSGTSNYSSHSSVHRDQAWPPYLWFLYHLRFCSSFCRSFHL